MHVSLGTELSITRSLYRHSFSPFQLTECGSVESGIRAMSWSPDQELLVIVTGKKKEISYRNIHKHGMEHHRFVLRATAMDRQCQHMIA